jgi:hypothetical protein
MNFIQTLSVPVLALIVGVMVQVVPARSADAIKVEAVIAVDSETKPTDVFSPTVAKLHAFFRSTGTEKGDRLRGVWIAEDVGSAAPANTKIDEATITADQEDFYGAFSLTKPDKGWPVGKYKVEIYLNDELVTTVKFSIVDNN